MKTKRRSDIAKLVSHCRIVWRQSEFYQKVKKLAKDPNRPGWFICAKCGTSREVVQVDHFEPIGKQPDSFTEFGPWLLKLFCSSQWALCKDCHKAKSKEERKRGAYKKPEFCQHDDSSWCTDACPGRKKENPND